MGSPRRGADWANHEWVPFGCDGCGAGTGVSGVGVTLHCGQLCNTFCPSELRYAAALASQSGQTICFLELKRWILVPWPLVSRTQTVSHVGQDIAAPADVVDVSPPPRVEAQPASVVTPKAMETIEVVVKRRNM
jgi:hypothetical protein